MYNQRVIEVKQLPISLHQRKYTDVICTCLHFFALLTLIAFALYYILSDSSISHADAANTQNNKCQRDYNLLWIQQNEQSIICVQTCPINYSIISGICYPINQRQLANYLSHSPFKQPYYQYQHIKLLITLIIFTFSISMILAALIYFLPEIIQKLIVIFSILFLVYAGLIVFEILKPFLLQQIIQEILLPSKNIYIIIISILLGLLIGWISCFYSEFTWNSLMLDKASKIISFQIIFIVYLLQYYFWICVNFIIFALQMYAFTKKGNYLNSWLYQPQLKPLIFFNLFIYIWNFQHIKDTYYFSLSNLIHFQYFKKDMDYCTNCQMNWTHFGSRSGGSLVNLLFALPNLIFDLICCFPKNKYQNCALWCTSFSGIARRDAYAYQSLSGIPYCNSSRQIRYFMNQSNHIKGVNSPLNTFRLFLKLLIYLINLTFITQFSLEYNTQSNIWINIIFLLISDGISSGIIYIFIDAAQILQTVVLVDIHLSSIPHQFLQDLKYYTINQQFIDQLQ